MVNSEGKEKAGSLKTRTETHTIKTIRGIIVRSRVNWRILKQLRTEILHLGKKYTWKQIRILVALLLLACRTNDRKTINRHLYRLTNEASKSHKRIRFYPWFLNFFFYLFVSVIMFVCAFVGVCECLRFCCLFVFVFCCVVFCIFCCLFLFQSSNCAINIQLLQTRHKR